MHPLFTDHSPVLVSGRCGSEAAQHRGDDAEDGGLGAVDGLVGLVVRHQPHLAVLALEGLDGGLVTDQGGDDLAVAGGLLLADHHVVAVADRGVDHRVAGDLEQEELTVADELLRQREDRLDALLGQDRPAGGDPAHDRHVGGLRHRVADVGLVDRALVGRGDRLAPGHQLGQEHLEGTGPVRVALEEALLLEDLQLVGDAGGAGQAHGLTDLAHARRVAARLDGLLDVRQHLHLARGQPGRVRGPVGQLCDLPLAGAAVLGRHRVPFVREARAGVSARWVVPPRYRRGGRYFKHLFERRVAGREDCRPLLAGDPEVSNNCSRAPLRIFEHLI